MFSNRDMPLKAETVEYAWLFEITSGTLTGQITAPQLSGLVQCVSNFVFSAIDLENAIVSRRSGELCQHAQVPVRLTSRKPVLNCIRLIYFCLLPLF